MKKALQILYIFIIGACIGLIVGLSQSPVIQSILTSLLAVLTGVFMYFFNKKKGPELSTNGLGFYMIFILSFTISGIFTFVFVKDIISEYNFTKYKSTLYQYLNKRNALMNSIDSSYLTNDLKKASITQDSVVILDHLFDVELWFMDISNDTFGVEREHSLINSNKGFNKKNNQSRLPSSLFRHFSERRGKIGFLTGKNENQSNICENLKRASTIEELKLFDDLPAVQNFIDTTNKTDYKSIQEFVKKVCEEY